MTADGAGEMPAWAGTRASAAPDATARGLVLLAWVDPAVRARAEAAVEGSGLSLLALSPRDPWPALPPAAVTLVLLDRTVAGPAAAAQRARVEARLPRVPYLVLGPPLATAAGPSAALGDDFTPAELRAALMVALAAIEPTPWARAAAVPRSAPAATAGRDGTSTAARPQDRAEWVREWPSPPAPSLAAGRGGAAEGRLGAIVARGPHATKHRAWLPALAEARLALWATREAIAGDDPAAATAAWRAYASRTAALQRQLATDVAALWDDPPLRTKLLQLAAEARRLEAEAGR